MTKSTYEVLEKGTIKRTDADGSEWFIPADPANSDYQRYLNKDKAEQSTPSVIDEAEAK
jgi:hypothetical protein